MTGLVVAALALVVGQAPGRAHAWGARGHRVATAVAEDRLTPEARRAVRELLHEGDTLVGVANWADHEGHEAVPASAPWHYVTVPIAAPHYDARFSHGNDVVSKIRQYRAVLADRDAPRAERARALLFLVHFIEDVHQPLHVGDDRDRGGNDTQVQFLGEGTNLHRLWDSDLIRSAGQGERDWVEQVARLVTPENVRAWSRGDVAEWADESLQAARVAYRLPGPSSRPIARGDRLGDDYAQAALPVVRLRLAQAAVRLANELNAIFR